VKAIQTLLLALLGVVVSGCVTQPMGTPQASMAVVQKLRAADLPAMKVGNFVPAPKLRAGADSSAEIRALTLVSPIDKSFAKYLGKTIEENLKAAGKLDPNTGLVVEALLTETDVDSTIGTGTAKLGAQFTLRRDGQSVFTKHLLVDDRWDSVFLGAVAIPDAANHYTMLYDRLAEALFTDADFLAAAKPKP
jgi:hypothetical protein